MLGVDFSSYGGDISQETIQGWQSAGVKFAIVQYSAMMDHQLNSLTGSGISCEAYVYLYWGLDPWGQSPQQRTRKAILLADNRIGRLWLDAEDVTNPFQEQQLLECVQLCQDQGMPVGIYTGRWWWTSYGHNSPRFSDLPLWHAEYTNEIPDFGKFQPYGGWEYPLIWQYHNTTSFHGHDVDLNWIDDGTTPPEEEYGPMKLNEDGSSRIEAQGNQIVIINQGVPVLVIGNEDGSLPGQIKKLFGDAYYWLRFNLKSGRVYNSKEEGD